MEPHCATTGAYVDSSVLWQVELVIEHVVDCLKRRLEDRRRVEDKVGRIGPMCVSTMGFGVVNRGQSNAGSKRLVSVAMGRPRIGFSCASPTPGMRQGQTRTRVRSVVIELCSACHSRLWPLQRE